MAQNKPDDALVFQLGEDEDGFDVDQFDDMGNGGGNHEIGDSDVAGLIPAIVSKAQDPRNPVDLVDPAIFGYDISKLEEKGWAKPGADITDYFNYGLNERTWRGYCAMQAQGIDSLKAKADEFITKIVEEHGGSSAAAAGMMYSQLGIVGSGGASGAPGGAFHGMSHNASHPLYKTRLCNAFMEGACSRGDRCTFAHGPEELRASDAHLKPRHMMSGMPGGVLSGPMSHGGGGSIGYDMEERRPVPTPTTIGLLPLPPTGGAPSAPIPTPTPTVRIPQPNAAGGGGFRMMPAAKRERSPANNDVYEQKY